MTENASCMSSDAVNRLTDRYDREALSYRELWAPILRIAGSSLIKYIPGPGIHRILDLGSGVGGLIPDLIGAFPDAQIVAVDRSAGMLRSSDHDFPKAIVDATQLAIASKSMDLTRSVQQRREDEAIVR